MFKKLFSTTIISFLLMASFMPIALADLNWGTDDPDLVGSGGGMNWDGLEEDSGNQINSGYTSPSVSPEGYDSGSGSDTGAWSVGGSGSGISQSLENPLGSTTTIYVFLQKVLKVVADIGFPIIVLAIVYSGFLYIKAQGNPEGLKDAKSALTWSVVGGAVILGAWVLAKAIEGTINVL